MGGFRGIQPFDFPDEHPYPYRVKYPVWPSYRCRDCGNKIGKEQYGRYNKCGECESDMHKERRTCYRAIPIENERPRIIADVAVQLGMAEGKGI